MLRNSGFSLIELLIVVAILGILAGLILAAVGTSRHKAEDLRVKSGVRQLRLTAENFFDGNSYSYTGFDTCVDTPNTTNCPDQATVDTIVALKADIVDANQVSGSVDAAADANGFCVTAPARSSATTYICSDAGGEVYEDTATASPCSGASPVCTY